MRISASLKRIELIYHRFLTVESGTLPRKLRAYANPAYFLT